MICILTLNENREILYWILATDTRDAWRQANAAAIGKGVGSSHFQLLEWLTARKSMMLPVGKQELSSGHIVIVT